jgi:hypothetical protein
VDEFENNYQLIRTVPTVLNTGVRVTAAETEGDPHETG